MKTYRLNKLFIYIIIYKLYSFNCYYPLSSILYQTNFLKFNNFTFNYQRSGLYI